MTGLPRRFPAPAREAAPTLTATRISSAIWPAMHAPRLRGSVLSVHRSAINIACEGWLLTVSGPSGGGLPNGVLLADDTPLDRIGLRPGMALVGDGRSLHLPSAACGISYADATPWSPMMPSLPILSTSQRARRLDDALRSAAERAPVLGFGPLLTVLAGAAASPGTPLAARAAGRLGGLLDAIVTGDLPAAGDAASGLIGLGPGATPSGDDLLVGLLAGLAARRHPIAADLARMVAARSLGRTTALAEAFLQHAGRLEFAERVHRAAHGVLAPNAPSRRDSVGQALAWGASSGADLLVGLLAGLNPTPHLLAARLRGVGPSQVAAA